MDQEDDNFKNEDHNEEKRMLDNLDWVLKFMRTYEKKKEDFKRRMEFNRNYLFRS